MRFSPSPRTYSNMKAGPSMNAPTIPVTENVADLDSGATENEFPNGDDLAIPEH